MSNWFDDIAETMYGITQAPNWMYWIAAILIILTLFT
jgi:hypothetical protein